MAENLGNISYSGDKNLPCVDTASKESFTGSIDDSYGIVRIPEDTNENNNNKQQQSVTFAEDALNNNNEKDNKNDILDEEGLKHHYDVIVCGTGLVQSIVASALARCNKSILHIDCNDYYGELDAVYTYPYLVTTKLVKTKRNDAQEEEQQHDEGTDKDASNRNYQNDNNSKQLDRDYTIKLLPKGSCSSIIFHSHDTVPTDPLLYHRLYPFLYESSIVSTPYGYGTIVHIPTTTTTNPETTSTTMSNSYKNPAEEKLMEMVCIHIRLLSSSNTIICIAVDSSKIHCTSDTVDTKTTGSNSAIKIKIDSYYMYTQYNILSFHYYKCNQLLNNHSRSFALDINPTLLYAASGLAVPSLLKSNVADYIEFKSCEGLFVYNYHNTAGTTTSTTKNSRPGTNHEPLLSRVPCSKNDVFASQMLSPIEKRRLMKFIQLAYDYAIVIATSSEDHTEHEQQNDPNETHSTELSNHNVVGLEEEIQTRNEKHLNTGRSLGRPQNKSIATNEMQFLQDCVKQSSMSFEEYLSVHHHLSPILIRLVRYALALDSNSDDTVCTMEYGMNLLCQHIMSLGHFGTTAFLVPMYGSGEMSQAFCRSAAVYGATYLLRRTPLSIVLEDEQNGNEVGTINNDVDTPQGGKTSLKVKGVIIDVPCDETSLTNTGNNVDNTSGAPETLKHQQKTKLILCNHVVVPKQAVSVELNHNVDIPDIQSHSNNGSSNKLCVLRRISILSGKPWFVPASTTNNSINNNQQQMLLPNQQQIRYVVVIPPKTVIRCGRSSSSCCTTGTEKHDDIVTERTIHVLFLDDTTNVAPNIGCTVVHMITTETTTGPDDEKNNPSNKIDVDRDTTTPTKSTKIDHHHHHGILQYVLQSILDECNHNYKVEQQMQHKTNTTTNATMDRTLQSMDVEEIFHVCFSYEMDCVATGVAAKEKSTFDPINSNHTTNQTQKQRIHGLEWTHRQQPKLSSDDSFQQAKDIFNTICPGMDFLAISKEMDETIQKRFGTDHDTTTNRRRNDDDDIDQYVLESAVDMITKDKETQQQQQS